MPQILRENRIPFHCIKQEKGEYVIIFPGAYHMVVNAGQNFAEAINYCSAQWAKISTPKEECRCPGSEYSKVQRLFKYSKRQAFRLDSVSNKRRLDFAKSLCESPGKCSNQSVGLAFTTNTFFFIRYAWITWIFRFCLLAFHLQRMKKLRPARPAPLPSKM
jgi:hypothetical protein